MFIYNNNIFRKFYNILSISHDERLSKSSGYCSGDSIGYLKYLKKKYKFIFNPKVINFEDSSPDSNWAVYDNNLKNNDDYKILLNYQKTISMVFKPMDKIFFSSNHAKYQAGIKEIIFNLKSKKMKINYKIIIFRKIEGSNEKEIIYNGYINQTITNNAAIFINHQNKKINNVYKPIFIEMPGLAEKQILEVKKITLNLENQFNLKKLKVIDNHKNCYYVYEWNI